MVSSLSLSLSLSLSYARKYTCKCTHEGAHKVLECVHASRGPCTSCITSFLKHPEISQLYSEFLKPLSKKTSTWNPDCTDWLETYANAPYQGAEGTTAIRSFANKIQEPELVSAHCAAGCPSLRKPFCRAGQCVTPTCADAAPVRVRVCMPPWVRCAHTCLRLCMHACMHA